jgi:rhodanese-related sulfurtransferase
MTRLHRAFALLAAALAVAAWRAEPARHVDEISAPELADRIVGQDAGLRVFDLRSRQEFDQLHVGGATHMILDDLRQLRLPPSARIVLYANDDDRATQGGELLRARGYHNVVILREGIYAWIAGVLEPRLPTDATPEERATFDRAAQLSRFFGGMPRSGVSRSELAASDRHAFVRQAVAGIRRRGC